ncbi:peptidylprolyl isomerase [Cryobacterium psychrotolerans]|uniref:peptidylprolyl isomerase n=1 Tax=Cryobacterium psychrotolerans TaxID=386301 RepID=A0A1G8ZI70_9MICO|nr:MULTISPECIES: FKBP-type peptidyl-prolyl cis-trans isomerase [Cryobacterium]SDK14812.1 peptidylprolyl isomerase [Cryobacterium psychrotolerans]
MRKAFASIATAGLLIVALTACAPGTNEAGCEAPVKEGAASKLVEVDGKFGSKPKVDFPTPLKAKTTERSEVIAGEGKGLATGQKVKIDLSVYNGTTGKVIEESKYDGTTLAGFVLNDKTIKGLSQGLKCAQEGSRLTLAVAPKDAFGPQGGNEQIGVKKNDTLVFVLDVVKAYKTRADGDAQPAKAGMPAVVLADNGAPGITIPASKAPTKLEINVLKKGDGKKVKEGDPVTVHYTGVLWDTKKVFDSSWKTGEPAEFAAADGSTTQGGVIPGFAKALVGQTVGSQVIAVIPPDQGYGDQASDTIPAGSTLVFVVDILGIK